MRIVFFGSGEFGIPTLDALLAAGHDIPAVVSQPDRPSGRGGKVRPTPLAARAAEHGLAVTTPVKPNTPEFEAELRALEPELAVVVAYGHLIGKPLLAVPRKGFVNLHASLLPAYRGAAPVPWAILSGESVSGASVFRLDEKFDTGGVIDRVELPISDDDTSGSYLEKLAPAGAALMVRAVQAIADDSAVVQVQDDSQASRAPKFTKEDGRIDWSRPFAEIERRVRAFQPWPQAFTVFETNRGPLRVNVGAMVRADGSAATVAPGGIVQADAKAGLVVMTRDGPARLAVVQPEGKKRMADTDFLRGTTIKGMSKNT
ncbi:MAG: methionyl-tRNA formyltransferase [Planctomycetes bacterium]|nr:methionyl-tRNA formyltransferase [Planctomycetota bacterium]